ncbi:MAG TPA: hypothetical protein VFN37_03815 [Candidatus Baltobacteraceae bacterium]|nr:hypothetical protein [Candidatus Baltobacteraceae bacterium]
MRSVALAALAAFAFGALLAQTSAAPQCYAVRGMHVMLFGGVDDPDVLVWDSRVRLISYGAGSTDARQFLLPHALLNRPGTRAVVQSCVAGVVHSKFSMDADDAVGVQIISGRYRGRYGWVSSSDIRGRGIPEAQEPW